MGGLNCPVCQNHLQEQQRGGISIDTCPQCRGIWLDRGELEKLMGDFRQERPVYGSPAAPRHDYDDDHDDHHRRYSAPHSGQHYGYGKRKKSPLENILEIFD